MPLALVLALSVVAARVVDAAIGEAWFGSTQLLTTAFGILSPFAFALGAAALLVTQEFELGTLAWLRSQPIGWRHMLSVKLTVALLGLLALWAATWICWAADMRGSIIADDPAWAAAWGPYLALNSLQILFWAFLAALLGRSSLAALFLVVPAALASMTLAWSLAAMLTGQSVDAGHPGGTAGLALLVVLGLVCLLLLVAVYWLASRRLVGSGRLWERGTAPQELNAPSLEFYQPPNEPPRSAAPSPLRALLWHHVMSWPGVRAILFASVLGAVALVAMGQSHRPSLLNWQSPIGIFAAIILAGAAGASAIAPENERGRQRFFADHGVLPAAVWATRLVLPLLLVLPLCVAAIAFGLTARDPQPQPLGSMGLLGLLSAFAAGVLAGQLAARPVVGVVSGALLGLFAAGVAGLFLSLYPAAWWAYLPGVVIAVGLSLRLARRWLDGRRGWGLYARAAGWLTAAVAVVLGVIVPLRLGDLPKVNASQLGQLARDAEVRRQRVMQTPGRPPITADPEDPEVWAERLRQGPLGERFNLGLWSIGSLIGNRHASRSTRDAVASDATEEDFFRTHRDQLDEIVAVITRANQELEISNASLLALRIGADGALQAGDQERAVAYLTALLRAVGDSFQVDRRLRWALYHGLENLHVILELLDELEALVFGGGISPDARESLLAALREGPAYRASVRSGLLLGWLWNTELIEEGWSAAGIASFNFPSNPEMRIFLLPWERLRSQRWLDAATVRELAILEESPEDLSAIRQERVALWSNAAGMGGPGVEPLDERLYPHPSQGVDFAIAADQRVARLLERLERNRPAEE